MSNWGANLPNSVIIIRVMLFYDFTFAPIIHDSLSASTSPNGILDILKESEKLKVGQKWTVIVTPKSEGIEGYPAKLE